LSGDAALTLFDEHDKDYFMIIFTDNHMPGMVSE
jgi:hypothetical protein